MPHQCTNCGRTFPDGSKEMLSGCPDCGGNKFQFAPAAETEAVDSPEDGTDAPEKTADSPATTADSTAAAPDGVNSSDDDEPTSTRSGSVTSRAAETVRDWVSTGSTETERSWPSAEADSESPPAEFEEWPETARPPADRSPPEEPTSPRSTTRADAAASPADSRVRDADSDDPTDSDSTDVTGGDSTDLTDGKSNETTEEASNETAGEEDSAQASARSEIVSPEELPETDDRPPKHGRVVSEPSGEEQSLEDLREELNDQFESIKIVSPGQYELNLMELYDREEYIVSLQEDGRYVIDVPDSWREGDE